MEKRIKMRKEVILLLGESQENLIELKNFLLSHGEQFYNMSNTLIWDDIENEKSFKRTNEVYVFTDGYGWMGRGGKDHTITIPDFLIKYSKEEE